VSYLRIYGICVVAIIVSWKFLNWRFLGGGNSNGGF
jgi:hypothetical protein